jgi:photosystem I subunit VIII
MADITQLTGDYAASWLPWIMIPLIFYILPFPIFALAFLWIEREASSNGLETITADASSETKTTFPNLTNITSAGTGNPEQGT